MDAADLRLLDVFEDLEQQAAGLQSEERSLEVEQIGRAEYASVELVARLHASLGRQLSLDRGPSGRLSGELARVGSDFCLLAGGRETWALPLHALGVISGLSPNAVAEPARPIQSRLSVRGLLRRLAEEGQPVLVELGERSCTGRIGRVGRDFFELEDDRVIVLPAVTAIRVSR